ncbi:MAG: hypothetical protein PHP31_07645 [Lentimicrobiaceae bacterium]|nr:hypothetical protein [Lentimicrobiaceae bacterium]
MNGIILKTLINSIGTEKIANSLNAFLLENLNHNGQKVHILLVENDGVIYFQKYLYNSETCKYMVFGEKQNLTQFIDDLLNKATNG